MASSSVNIIILDDKSLCISVVDFGVEMFGGSDWEWEATLDKANTDKLRKELRKEYINKKLSLREMLLDKFTETFYTDSFCNSVIKTILNIRFVVGLAEIKCPTYLKLSFLLFCIQSIK